MTGSLEAIAAELREATDASRVTIRLDTPGEVYPVVVSTGGLAGIVSVHHAATVRDWTEAEAAAAEAAAARVRDLL